MAGKFKLFVAGLAGLLLTATAGAAEYGPQDHAGANWTLAGGDVVYGVHQNVGTMTIPSGATVTVKPYQTAVAGSGLVEVHAVDIQMANATLSATGSGNEGGAGGGGGGGAGSYQGGTGGAGGNYSRNGHGAMAGVTAQMYDVGGRGGNGGAGGGSYGGANGYYGTGGVLSAGASGTAGVDGKYLSTADTSVDESLAMGSGGGGGGGGGGGDFTTLGGGGGGAGGAGGSGGGHIKLYAVGSINAAGAQLLAKGTSGGNGTNGSNGNSSYIFGSLGGNGGRGGHATESGAGLRGNGAYGGNYGGNGAVGGSGAGGGLLLYCDVAGGISLNGATLDTRGGGNQTTNGGTAKFFCSTTDPTANATLNVTRIFKDLSLNPDTQPPTYASAVGIQSVQRVEGQVKVTLTWAAATDDNTSGANMRYRIYASTSQAAVFSGSPLTTVVGATTTDVEAGLETGNAYYFGVRAADLGGNEEQNTATILSDVLSAVSPAQWASYE